MPPDGQQIPATPTRATKTRPIKGKWAAFLKELAKCGNISAACRVSGVDRGDAYNRRAEDSDFALRWEASVQIGLDRQEEEADRRATRGVRKLMLHKGAPVRLDKAEGEQVDGWIESKDPKSGEPMGWGFVYEVAFSDSLLTLLLKAGRPDKFADRKKVDASVKGELGVAVSRTMADAMAAVRAHRAAGEHGDTPAELPATVAATIAAAVVLEEAAEDAPAEDVAE